MSRFDDQAIIDAMGLLSEELRWMLLLVDVVQLDHADAAEILDVAVGSRQASGRDC